MEQVPPPFVPGAPVRKKSNSALIWTIVITCIVCLCGVPIVGGLYGWSFLKKNVMPLAACQVGFEDVRLAVLEYAKSHDGKLPDAATWQDSVRSYYQDEVNRSGLKDQPVFTPMDAKGQWGCPPLGDSPATGMAFNSDLSGKSVKSIEDPYGTPLVFEVPNPAANAHEAYKDRGRTAPPVMGTPRNWMVAYVAGGVRINNNGDFNMRSTRQGADPFDEAKDADKSSDGTKSSKDSSNSSDKKDSSSSSGNSGEF